MRVISSFAAASTGSNAAVLRMPLSAVFSVSIAASACSAVALLSARTAFAPLSAFCSAVHDASE